MIVPYKRIGNTPSPCITLLLVLGKICVIQIPCYPNYLVNTWLKEGSFTYALYVKQEIGMF